MPTKGRKTCKKLDDCTAKQVRRLALDVVKRQSETKTSSFQAENDQLYHAMPFFHHNMLYTVKGDNSGDRPGQWTIREGDELYLQSIKLKLWLSNKQDRPNVIYRVIVYWYNADQTPAVSDVLNVYGLTLLNTTNRERISVVHDSYVRNVRDAPDGKEHSTLKFVTKNWKNKKILYNDTLVPDGYVPKKRDLGFMVLAYDAHGTLTTDNIASMSYQYDVKYKEN